MGEGLGSKEIPQGLAVGVQTVEKNQIKRSLVSQRGMEVLVARDRVVSLIREGPAACGIEAARINCMFLGRLHSKKGVAFSHADFQITLDPA